MMNFNSLLLMKRMMKLVNKKRKKRCFYKYKLVMKNSLKKEKNKNIHFKILKNNLIMMI